MLHSGVGFTDYSHHNVDDYKDHDCEERIVPYESCGGGLFVHLGRVKHDQIDKLKRKGRIQDSKASNCMQAGVHISLSLFLSFSSSLPVSLHTCCADVSAAWCACVCSDHSRVRAGTDYEVENIPRYTRCSAPLLLHPPASSFADDSPQIRSPSEHVRERLCVYARVYACVCVCI